MIDVVYGKINATQANPLGGTTPVIRGSVWPAADPFVREHRWMFSADPRWAMQYTEQPAGWDDPPIPEDDGPAEPSVRGHRASVSKAAAGG